MPLLPKLLRPNRPITDHTITLHIPIFIIILYPVHHPWKSIASTFLLHSIYSLPHTTRHTITTQPISCHFYCLFTHTLFLAFLLVLHLNDPPKKQTFHCRYFLLLGAPLWFNANHILHTQNTHTCFIFPFSYLANFFFFAVHTQHTHNTLSIATPNFRNNQ